MVQKYVYRAAYTFGDAEDATVHFSDWVDISGIDEIESVLEAVNPSRNGGEAGVTPTILGWEKKELDTEPT